MNPASSHLRTAALRLLLPLILLLAQHGVWAHGFEHDCAKLAGSTQTQDGSGHACCLPYQSAGDSACATAVLPLHAPAALAALHLRSPGCSARICLHFASRAPPLNS